ncbi:MAG: GTP-binding protein [Lachnospiraceae bacterium]|nr:GTP-binding protein [Lachnospiraceae bacterium]
MVTIDLITGFLGSGKTTFIKKYAKYLMDCGEHLCILENDYGAVNVDMMLLQELRGDQCELEMVAGGCDYDCHKRRFKTKLISMGMSGYDRALVEPSGIFDVDEFFDALYEEPLDRWYQIGNVIAIVDARLEKDLSKESDYLLASQLANAGMTVLSRAQEVKETEIADTIGHINRAMEQVHCSRRFEPGKEMLCKDWSRFDEQDWQTVSRCGYETADYVKLPIHEENGYSTLYYMNVRMTEQELRKRTGQLLQDHSCGRIFRIKGFLRVDEGRWIELNATQQEINIRPIGAGQEVLIVIGEKLAEEKIRAYWES